MGIYGTTKGSQTNQTPTPLQIQPRQLQQQFGAEQNNHESRLLPKTNFNLNGPVSRFYSNMTGHMGTSLSIVTQQNRPSIHESGLPSLRPKQAQGHLQLQQKFSSLNFRNHIRYYSMS